MLIIWEYFRNINSLFWTFEKEISKKKQGISNETIKTEMNDIEFPHNNVYN